jgi:hypothetical protein
MMEVLNIEDLHCIQLGDSYPPARAVLLWSFSSPCCCHHQPSLLSALAAPCLSPPGSPGAQACWLPSYQWSNGQCVPHRQSVHDELFYFGPLRPSDAVIVGHRCDLLWPLPVLICMAPLVLRCVVYHLLEGAMDDVFPTAAGLGQCVHGKLFFFGPLCPRSIVIEAVDAICFGCCVSSSAPLPWCSCVSASISSEEQYWPVCSWPPRAWAVGASRAGGDKLKGACGGQAHTSGG